MRILKEDEYINCDELIKEANDLYKLVIEKEIDLGSREANNHYKNYFMSMNTYINKYKKFREKLIKTYIEDLNELLLRQSVGRINNLLI